MAISTFTYKPDWSTAEARWDAYWAMEAMDRPCMIVYAPRPNGVKVPIPDVSLEGQWMDPGLSNIFSVNSFFF